MVTKQVHVIILLLLSVGNYQVSQHNDVSCVFFMDILYQVKKVHFSLSLSLSLSFFFLAVLGLSLLHGLFSLVA